ncbi:MAG: hypothetical protein OXP36_04325 [Gammaproteobacteria bacterium]|nr:hypothetical protein [Gammaproteobacteria bacterium]
MFLLAPAIGLSASELHIRLALGIRREWLDRSTATTSSGSDSEWIAYYGTVLEIEGELWMWYLGQRPDEHWHQRVCLAKSQDGRSWEKPDLGLVEYHGSKHNNLVDMGEDVHVQACVVFHETEEPDPNKRFKRPSSRASTRVVCVPPTAPTD